MRWVFDGDCTECWVGGDDADEVEAFEFCYAMGKVCDSRLLPVASSGWLAAWQMRVELPAPNSGRTKVAPALPPPRQGPALSGAE